MGKHNPQVLLGEELDKKKYLIKRQMPEITMIYQSNNLLDKRVCVYKRQEQQTVQTKGREYLIDGM